MANGILVIDKSAGWTSQDVAAKLRGVFHERRVGHGGTLDPLATGVLPVFIGRATRAAEFLESAEKEYVAGLRPCAAGGRSAAVPRPHRADPAHVLRHHDKRPEAL